MGEPIKIAFDMDDIEKKSDSEKLNMLLHIAFSNHEALLKHGKVLFGNGQEGICEIVRKTAAASRVLWGLFITSVCGFAWALFMHMKG